LVGDPFFPAIIAAYGAISKGVKIVKGIQAARKTAAQIKAQGAPPPTSSMIGGRSMQLQRSPVFAGGALPIEENTSYIQKVLKGTPAGQRIQSFPAGVSAYSTGRRRYRRMNVLNLRALKRAIRRAKGFEHIARQVLTVPSHFKKHIRARGRKR
jgi:hypothetical protein